MLRISGILAEEGFELMVIGSMDTSLTIEPF